MINSKKITIIANAKSFSCNVFTLDAVLLVIFSSIKNIFNKSYNNIIVNFKKENSNGEYMSNNTGIITTTGTGSQVTAGTIYGEVPGGQSGKISGTYSKVLSLQIVYGN